MVLHFTIVPVISYQYIEEKIREIYKYEYKRKSDFSCA